VVAPRTRGSDGKIDILCLGEDLGSQKGPTMSPETFDSFFRPRCRSSLTLLTNSCEGDASFVRLDPPASAQTIEMGLDVLDAVQPEPVGMDPEELKREYGDKLTYCGMISTQQHSPHGCRQCRRRRGIEST